MYIQAYGITLGVFNMLKIIKSISTLAVLISLPLAAIAEDTVMGDVKDAVRSTGQGIENVSNKVEGAVKGAAKDTSQYTSDAVITAQVKTKIATEKDIPISISVTTTKGVVYLTGDVDTGLQADKAAELAASVHGVKDVDSSKLNVKSSDSYFSDAFTTAKVKGHLMQLTSDSKIGANDLKVETTNGVVHIMGTIKKSADQSVIKKSVSGLKDVKDVKMDLKVAK